MNIAIYSICKNEEKNIDRYLEMAQEADSVYILDTGSTDQSVDRLSGGHPKLTIQSAQINPWRFDDARNLSLSLVPREVDLCLWMDLDEYFEPGWRNIVEKNVKNNIQRYHCFFENKQSLHRYVHFKIHQRNGCFWRYPIHEQLIFDGDDRNHFIEELTCYHNQDLNKDRSQYVDLLEFGLQNGDLPVEEYAHLLVREYFMNQKFQKCVDYFRSLHKADILFRLSKQRVANCYRYFLTSLEKSGAFPDEKIIEEYAAIYPLRDHYYVAAWNMKYIGNYKRALDFLSFGDKRPDVDLQAEFIHPSARSQKYESLRLWLKARLYESK